MRKLVFFIILSLPLAVFSREKTLSFKVIKTFPHEAGLFTQGLEIDGDILFESGGGYGSSVLLAKKLSTQKVLYQKKLKSKFFAEGLTVFNNHIYLLTWKENLGMILNKKNFKLIDTFTYKTEGWGLAHSDEGFLIMSDGSEYLYIRKPPEFKVHRKIRVKGGDGEAVKNINELEYVNGKIYANILNKNEVIRISLQSGTVEARCDFNGLLDAKSKAQLDKRSVLNGIAYNYKTGHFMLTGKNWPKIFEIKILD